MIDDTVAHTGSYSAKLTDCGATPVLSQNITLPSHEAIDVTLWVKTDSAFRGSVDVIPEDDTHGGFPASAANYRLMQVGANSDWVELEAVFYPDQLYHHGDNWRIKVYVTGESGTIWFDDFSVRDYWCPFRTFLEYPSYRGYLWDDKPQVVRGVSESFPPAGLTASSLAIKVDTVDGCPNENSLGLDQTIASPSAVQPWGFDGSRLATGSSYFVCTQVTWSDGTTMPYHAWKIVKMSRTVRDDPNTGFANWFDSDGAWVHHGQRHIFFGTYDRLSGKWRCETCLFTAKEDYETGINSMGVQPPLATTADDAMGIRQSQAVVDYQRNRFNFLMSDITGMGCCVEPQAQYGDQLTPWLQALADYGISHAQLLNNWYGTLIKQAWCSSPCTDATLAGTPPPPLLALRPRRGFLGENEWVFAEVSAVTDSIRHNDAKIDVTLPSPPASVFLPNGARSSVVVNMPNCPNYRWMGFYLYVATSNADSAPPNSVFQRQSGPRWYPCGARVRLARLINTGINPPTADTSNAGRNTDAETDPTIWTAVAHDMSRQAGLSQGNAAAGAGAFYMVDEPNTPLGYYPARYQYQILSAAAPDVPSWGVFDITGLWGWRETMDILGQDPYGYGGYLTASDLAAIGLTNRVCTLYTGTYNQLGAVSGCNPHEIDFAVDLQQRAVYGTRPQITVVQLFESGGVRGFTYPEMRRQYYKALVSCENWGNLGCGVMTWGWVYSAGMEDMYYGQHNTQAYLDNLQAEQEVMNLEPVWLAPVADSAQVNGGTGQVDAPSGERVTHGKIISNVRIDHSVASVCTFDGPGSAYDKDRVDWPFGPVRFLTKQMPNGDQWIFVDDLCGHDDVKPAVPFNVTFTLVEPPNSVVQLYGQDDPGHARTFAVTNNRFTDTFEDDEDVHVYRIVATPNTVNARPNPTQAVRTR